MAHAVRFTLSYFFALVAVTIMLGAVGIWILEPEEVAYSLKLLAVAISVVALLALLPAIFAVWQNTRDKPDLSPLQFAWLGTLVGFVESACFMWIAYNGQLADSVGYILLLSIAGFVGGGTMALAWNRLNSPSL